MSNEQWQTVVEVLTTTIKRRDSQIEGITVDLKNSNGARDQLSIHLHNAAGMAREAFLDINPDDDPYEQIRQAFLRIRDLKKGR